MKDIKVRTWLEGRDGAAEGGDEQNVGLWLRREEDGGIGDVLRIKEAEQLGMPIAMFDDDEKAGAIRGEYGGDIGRETVEIHQVFHYWLGIGQGETATGFEDDGVAHPIRGPGIANMVLLQVGNDGVVQGGGVRAIGRLEGVSGIV